MIRHKAVLGDSTAPRRNTPNPSLKVLPGVLVAYQSGTPSENPPIVVILGTATVQSRLFGL